MSPGWSESPSSRSFPPEEPEGVEYHLIESFVDATDIKPTLRILLGYFE